MKTLVSIFLSLLFTGSAFAQNSESQDSVGMSGKKAIIFNFNDFHLGSFDGGIGGKMWVSRSTCVIGALEFSTRNDYNETRREDVVQIKEDVYSTYTGLSLGINKHFNFYRKVSTYLGGKLRAGFEKYVSSSCSNYEHRDYDRQDISLSGGIVFGVEYFIMDGISLSGHYSLDLKHTVKESKHKESGNKYQSTDGKETTIKLGASSLILSIYF